MEAFFSPNMTVGEVKSRFKNLLSEYHPDKHAGAEFTFYNDLTRQLIEQYHAALKAADGQVSTGDDGKEHTYKYYYNVEQAVIDKLEVLLSFRFPDHVKIWLVGVWIWIEGTRREDVKVREQLKSVGCRWHSERLKWYWRQQQYRSRKSDLSFDSLKAVYGAQEIERQEGQSALK
jgi:outer membrane receptor for ferrienterochelin and colicin